MTKGLRSLPNQAVRHAGCQQNTYADEQGGVLASQHSEKSRERSRSAGIVKRASLAGPEAESILGQTVSSQKQARRKQQYKGTCQHKT